MEGWVSRLNGILKSYDKLVGQWKTARTTIERFAPEPADLAYRLDCVQDDYIDILVLHRRIRVRFFTVSPTEGRIVYSHVTLKDGHEMEHEIGTHQLDSLGNVGRTSTVADAEWHANVIVQWLEARG